VDLCNNVDGEALFTGMVQAKLPLAMFTKTPLSKLPLRVGVLLGERA